MKLREILALATFLMAGTAVAYAAPACINGDELQNYISLGSGGCEIGDAIYSSFSYTPTGGDPAAAQVEVGLDNNEGLFQTGVQLQTSGGLIWSSDFTLDYTVTIDQTACATEYGAGYTCSLTAAQMSFQGALAPNGATLGGVLTPGGTISLDDLATGDNAKQTTFAPETSQGIVMTGSAGTPDPIDSFGLDSYQTDVSPVPEPATFSLIGCSLLGLGLVRCKKVSRQ